MFLHDDDWDEGPSHTPTPEEEAAAKARYEARKAECLSFAEKNPLQERKFRVEQLVANVPGRTSDVNRKAREEWVCWARRRHPEWGNNPTPPHRLDPKWVETWPGGTATAWRAVDLETGIKSTLDATTINTPFGVTIADAKKAGFRVVETREVAFKERYDWSSYDFSGPVRKKPLDFLVRDVAIAAMQGRV